MRTAPSRATVLVIEEDRQLLRLIGMILEGAGYGVLSAEDDLSAWALLQDGSAVDLIVCDAGLTFDAATRSGKVLRLAAGAAAGEHPILQKPFKPAALLNAVRSLVG